MKRILLLSVVALLAACDPYVKQYTSQVTLPDDLKDCKFYTVKPERDGPTLNVVRCPLSETTVLPSQKSPTATATIEAPVPNAEAERQAKVDAVLKQIDANIARLEAQKKELQK